MKRRSFLKKGTLLAGSWMLIPDFRVLDAMAVSPEKSRTTGDELFRRFADPDPGYRPFIRWWWNGNKVEADELVRELKMLKDAGIGGVEINPIAFPTTGDDLGKRSLTWLSEEWIDLLTLTFNEAKKLRMTCDLIVGSGWPFGAETLPMEERAQVVLLYAEKLSGPMVFETSRFNIFKSVDPGVTVPNPVRLPEILSLKLVPDPLDNLDRVIDLQDRMNEEMIQAEIPSGQYYLYALVRFRSFASVINGAPGAAGAILNHFDARAVRKYLDHMSDTIQLKTGPLSGHLRAFFTDSMELEGCNWSEDLAVEFQKRRGYDLMPWLPFILFKVGRLGGVTDEKYGAAKTPELEEQLQRIRFDFEWTKAELLNERFTLTYLQWCRDLNVKSRAQAYGRGFFPLETSLGYDIPEGESWTTNWLKHKIGEEMPDEDYRRGRGYTWINKFVSSAAHLSGRRIVSCEEMTNTYQVFNETLELLKTGSDQSILSGITHSVWHGFNYSPPEAPFPGWVQYGSYYNENSNFWPYFHYLNDYKARISALLQNAVMYTDIAILPAIHDLWSESGVQTDPFPEKLNVPYTSLLWEAIHKTGGGADFISENILQSSTARKGKICFGEKEYSTLFLTEITRIFPDTLRVLYEFIQSGGRIFCIGKYPEKSLGFFRYEENDRKVGEWMEKLRESPESFVLVPKPETGRVLEWYRDLQDSHDIPHYLSVENPNRFVMQNRYQAAGGTEIFFFGNAHARESFRSAIKFPEEIAKGRYPWIWDAESGNKYRIELADGTYNMELGPAESRFIVFSRERKGDPWLPAPVSGSNTKTPEGSWEVELQHNREKWVKHVVMERLTDLKETEHLHFTGRIVYRKNIRLENSGISWINLGEVHGITELLVNGIPCGVLWYGRRIFPVSGALRKGNNEIEIRVVTTMGNYMKTLTDNPTAQKFTVMTTKNQPIQSMGLVGPVTFY